MNTKKAKGQIQGPSHEEIKIAVQNYLKNEGKIKCLEMKTASKDLNMDLESRCPLASHVRCYA